MRLGRAVDRGIIRRRAGSELRAFYLRDPNGISLLVWIKGMFTLLFEFEMEFIGMKEMRGMRLRGSKKLMGINELWLIEKQNPSLC